MPPYKTIILELLQEQYPTLHEQLRSTRTLLATVNQHSADLKAAHIAWMDELRRTSPDSDPSQISSEAMELAIQHIQGRLPAESPMAEAEESFSLDAAMAFIRRH